MKAEHKPEHDFSVGDAWKRYREQVIPAEAGEHQVYDTKCAFYGGASTILLSLQFAKELHKRDPVNGPAIATEFLNGLIREVDQFHHDIMLDIARGFAAAPAPTEGEKEA